MGSHDGAPGGIHGLLLQLHESLSDEDARSAALKCNDIVGDLGHESLLTPTENDLGKTVRSVREAGPAHPAG